MTIVEVYNEQIRDLLNSRRDGPALVVQEDTRGNAFIVMYYT